MSNVPPPIDPATVDYAGPESNSSIRTFAMLCHLLSLVGMLGIPLGNIIGPLVMWLIKRNDSPFVDAHGKEAINFNITFLIYGFICFLLVFILIGWLLLPVLGIAWIVLVIMASLKANAGEPYRYPFIFRFIK